MDRTRDLSEDPIPGDAVGTAGAGRQGGPTGSLSPASAGRVEHSWPVAGGKTRRLSASRRRSERGREDALLVARVLQGDTEAYRPLVERYERSVHGLLRRKLGFDRGEVDDLTQETFVRAYQFLDRLSEPASFGPWLFRIARSLLRDHLRRRETEKRALRRKLEALRLDSIPGTSPLGAVLGQLPPEEYQVLYRRYYQGLTYNEIAREMGLTFSKVDHLIRRARALLARKIRRERDRERAL